MNSFILFLGVISYAFISSPEISLSTNSGENFNYLNKMTLYNFVVDDNIFDNLNCTCVKQDTTLNIECACKGKFRKEPNEKD